MGKASPEYWRAYYAANREQRLSNQRASYRRHAAERNAANKRRREAADPEQQRAYYQAYYRDNIERYRERGAEFKLRRYGLDEQSFVAMLEAQNGKCGICGRGPKPGRMFDIDHDHATGAVRGLLCNPCNLRLGRIKDSPASERSEWQAGAATYLARALGDMGRVEQGTGST